MSARTTQKGGVTYYRCPRCFTPYGKTIRYQRLDAQGRYIQHKLAKGGISMPKASERPPDRAGSVRIRVF